ncbi:MAG: hypothetical protein WAM77_31245, partial [Xanthobacteraceae bacterium]
PTAALGHDAAEPFCVSAKYGITSPVIGCSMATFVFRCPNTALRVQGWSAEEIRDGQPDSYESITCTACGQLHFVNRTTGRALGEPRED